MKVLNTHSRIINQPISDLAPLLDTLSKGKDDKIWPNEKWPAMKFKIGLVHGVKGGHGLIRYQVSRITKGKTVEFTFFKPEGFNGTHSFHLKALDQRRTRISHEIDMHTTGPGTMKWILFVKPLHNALIKDSLDKVENQFNEKKKASSWNLYVRLLRFLVAR